MAKIVLIAFNGDPVCFVHVLLNALDMHSKGYDAKIVLEGAATKLVPELSRDGHPLSDLYRSVKDKRLFDVVCRACASKMGVLASVEEEGLRLEGSMSGHPSISEYIEAGYDVITF